MAFGDSLQTKTKSSGGFGSSLQTKTKSSGGFGSSLKNTLANDTGTSQGLEQIATSSGFQQKSQKILSSKGEDTNKIFSGGFISDIFDGLNALQYGVAGVLQGKGFAEGVKTRASFSDKDQLGKYGLAGTIGGIALDIAVDPLTWIAPWTIAKKIPGAVKLASAVKKLAFGTKVEKLVDIGDKTVKFTDIEGGSKIGKYLAEKFVYQFGADPVYKTLGKRQIKNIKVGIDNIQDMGRGIIDLPKNKIGLIINKDVKTGIQTLKSLDEMQKVLTPKEFASVQASIMNLDKLAKEAADLGRLDYNIYLKNRFQYLKQLYTKYEKPAEKTKNLFGYLKNKIPQIKGRKELTAAERAAAGQIENPAYLLMRSQIDLKVGNENSKLFKAINQTFGTDGAGKTLQEMEELGFKQIPKTQGFVSSAGIKSNILSNIKEINTQLKPLFAGLKKTFKVDRGVLSEISRVEKELIELGGKRAEELTNFFQEGQKITKEVAARGVKTGIPLVEKLPKDLFDIAQQIKRGEKYDVVKLAKLDREGLLERNGFSSIKKFIDFVKKPAELKPAKIIETTAKGNIPKIVKLQTDIEKLLAKSKGLKEIDKRSINDSFRFLEENIAGLTGKKETLIEKLGEISMGDLAGKYVPKWIANDLTELSKVANQGLGEKVVAGFKYGKVILNPASWVRNSISNKILNWWKLGVGPWRQDLYFDATRQVLKKTGGEWDEIKSIGGHLSTFEKNEIEHLLQSPEGAAALKAFKGKGQKVLDFFGNRYQDIEMIDKVAAYKALKQKAGLMGKKLTEEQIDDIWAKVQTATFDYSEVTPFVRKLRTSIWGYPFITFAIKSAPVAAETALKHPQRISSIGKIKNAIEQMSDLKETEKERASEPQWIKDGFYIKLPMKDKYGRSAYFDLTYILPFGDLVSGSFIDRSINRETGLPEGVPSALAAKSPLFSAVKELTKNQDFYGDKIFKDSDSTEKQLGDIFRYITKLMSPPLISDQIPGGWKNDGTRRSKGVVGGVTASEENQQRTLMQELLRNAGIKIQPIDADIQETYSEWEKKKALETLLLEEQQKTQFKQFEKGYIAK